MREPKLKEYYDIVRKITRDPIWSAERLRLIVNANLGRYNYLIPQHAQATSVSVESPRR
jgi:hypothetical protein